MQNQDKKFFTSVTGITIAALLVLCCCCFLLLAGALGGVFYLSTQVTPSPVNATPFIGGTPDNPNFNFNNETPTPFEVTRVPVGNIPTDTVKTIEESLVPQSDPRDLACRLENKCNIPETVPSGPFKVGDQQSFWLLNPDTTTNFQIKATLKYVTNHAYFWVQDGVNYSQSQAKNLLDTFETKIYPTDREFFGSEWTPGIDNDQHIYVVYVRGIGNSVGGYFSSPDEYPPVAYKYSNAHEMFVFNADNSPLNRPYTYGTLAHEFQHMIHWKQDENEDIWMNEGFSELAAFINNYTVGDVPIAYVSNPDLQLNDWLGANEDNGPHYGASFLFLTYFLDRFGEDATKALVRDQLNGLESIDDVLKTIKATDKVTRKPINVDDFFMDWAVTNDLLDGSVGDGRYVYHNYAQAPMAVVSDTVSVCPTSFSGSVHQYGVDYIHFNCSGKHTLQFEGSTSTGLLPVNAYSGKMAFWSNQGDSSDMTLTHEFDLSNVTGPVTLKYHTWYDVEEGYDYIYLEGSTDGGKSWQIIKTPSGTDSNPAGNSYGWGYTGNSGDWIEENVDLSQYKGQKVQIRFEYVTDPAVNRDGLMVDDISIPEINYSTNFETDDGGWQGQGFVRVENVLPQKFGLMLIDKNGVTSVQNVDLKPDQTAELNLDLTDVTLVVSGLTRFTREEALYTITVK